jgi:excisionase family DNA binding protein
MPEVLTLAEAAAYLRVQEQELLKLIHEQDLPARKVGTDYRVLKAAIQDWLREVPRPKKGIWALAGAFKDDPDLEQIVKDAYHRRGRPITEED